MKNLFKQKIQDAFRRSDAATLHAIALNLRNLYGWTDDELFQVFSQAVEISREYFNRLIGLSEFPATKGAGIHEIVERIANDR